MTWCARVARRGLVRRTSPLDDVFVVLVKSRMTMADLLLAFVQVCIVVVGRVQGVVEGRLYDGLKELSSGEPAATVIRC